MRNNRRTRRAGASALLAGANVGEECGAFLAGVVETCVPTGTLDAACAEPAWCLSGPACAAPEDARKGCLAGGRAERGYVREGRVHSRTCAHGRAVTSVFDRRVISQGVLASFLPSAGKQCAAAHKGLSPGHGGAPVYGCEIVQSDPSIRDGRIPGSLTARSRALLLFGCFGSCKLLLLTAHS